RRASLTFKIQNEAQLGAPVPWAVAFGSARLASRRGHRADEQFRRASLTFSIQNEVQLGARVLWAVAFGPARLAAGPPGGRAAQ
ncbi:hypothetical protein, partial [Luteitalea sp.]|uniref:hypothetical protein n=1 Tax=Luteitalea sp. TaxID=2004800 RepID=UPI0025C0CE1A